VESSIATVNDTCQERSKITQLLEYPVPFLQGLLLAGAAPNATGNQAHPTPSLIDFDDHQSKSSTIEQNLATTAAQDILNQEFDMENHFTETDPHIDESSTRSIRRHSDRKSTQTTDDEADSIMEHELALKLEERFVSADLDELFECHLEIKLLQKKTVQFAEQVLDTKYTNEDTGSEDDEFADAEERIEQKEKEKEEVSFSDDVLRLRDVHGQIYNLPFDLVKTWEVGFFLLRYLGGLLTNSQGMNGALILIYEHSPEYINYHSRENFRSRSDKYRTYGESNLNTATDTTLRPFQLYGPDGNAILTQVWSFVIEPGDLITMRFRNEKLNGIGAHPVTMVERSMGWLRSWWNQKDSVGITKKIPRDRQNRFKLARGQKAVVDWLAETGSVGRGSRRNSLSEGSYFTEF